MLRVHGLLRSGAFPHAAPEPALLETHISWVVLAGDYAYKIKKPVRLPFLDYSTLEARKHYCEEEVRLNRRLTPELYEGVSTIVATPEGLAVDQEGAVADYAVRMRRFPTDQRLDVRLADGRLAAGDLDHCARRIAAMHRSSPRAGSGGPYGTPEVVLGVVAAMIAAWFSRRREFRADEGGARLAGTAKMIAALERLRQAHEPQGMKGEFAAFGISAGTSLTELLSTHPPLEKRIHALKASI